MSETVPKAKPKRSWPLRLAWRGLRVLGWSLLGLAVLLVLVWFFRQQLVVPLVRSRLEALLAAELGAKRVSIGAIGGDCIGTIEVQDVVVEGAAAPLRELRGGRVDADFSLWTLLRGDLSGLRRATFSAAFVQLDLRPSDADASGPTSAGAFDPAPFEPLLRLLPEGARVRIDQLRLLAPSGERQGPLELDLRPGTGPRELVLAYAGVGIEATLPASLTGQGGAHRVAAQVDIDEPGAWLDLFGVPAGVREGKLHAAVAASWQPPLVEARIDLSDLVNGNQRLGKSHIVAWCDGERLAIDSATIDLPGVAAELRELTLPNPLAAGAVSLGELAGKFFVRVDDLAPHAALLPEQLRARMPIRGQLAGSFAAGLLQLEASDLQARGVHLALEQGSFPLASEDWRAAEGSLRFRLLLDAFAVDVPSLGETTLSGGVSGTVAGSLSSPRLEVRLDLGGCRTELGGFASAAGLLRGDPTSLAVEALAVQGLQVPSIGGEALTNVGLDASCRLRAGTIDRDSLAAVLDLSSFVPGDLLAPVFAAQGLGPAPQGPVTLQLEARHDANGIAVAALRLRTAPDSPVEVTIDGEGILPLHWSGAAGLTALDAGALVLNVKAQRPPVAAEEASLAFHGALHVDAHSVALRSLELAAGPCQLRGGIRVPRGIAELLAPAGPLEDMAVSVALDLEELDLAQLPAAWLGALALRGRVSGHIRAAGLLRELEPDIVLTLVDGGLSGEGLPACSDARLRLSVGSGDPATKALLVEAELSATLDPGQGFDELGSGRSVAFVAKVRCDDQGTELEPTVLELAGGQLALALRSNLRRTDLLGGTLDAGQMTLAGTIGLREFALARLPGTLLGVGAMKGVVSGEVALDGTLAALGPAMLSTATLSLRDGELKVAGLPRLEQLAAEIVCDQHQLTVRSLSGLLGAGRFTAQGTLSQPEALLVESFEDGKVEFQLAGEDVLLFRGEGAKVRATLAVTVTGTPRAMAVGGQVVMGRGSKYVRRISVLPDLNAQGGATANDGLRVAELPPAIGDRLQFDVAIKTKEPFEVRTSVFDGEIDVLAHLRGSGSAPRVEGTMSIGSGILRFPGANLGVVSGLLTFTRSEPLFPELLVQAEGKRMGFVISMTVTGRYDQPQVQLSSVPPLPPQDLIVLLTTGQLPSTLSERGAEGQARFVGGYLAQEVFETWFGSESTERGETLFDRLTIETGREVSKNGTESILVEYELTPTLSVQIERDSYEDYNLGLVLRFRFR